MSQFKGHDCWTCLIGQGLLANFANLSGTLKSLKGIKPYPGAWRQPSTNCIMFGISKFGARSFCISLSFAKNLLERIFQEFSIEAPGVVIDQWFSTCAMHFNHRGAINILMPKSRSQRCWFNWAGVNSGK